MSETSQHDVAGEDWLQELQRTRSPELFRRLVEAYQTRVFHLVLSIVGAEFRAEAEEVTQDVFLQVYRRLADFRGESRFSTWLYRIAYNRALDLRARARFRLPHTSEPQGLGSDSSDPMQALLASERGRALRAAMESLPDLYRSALNLHYWMGYSVDEIASQLATPPGTIKSYLHRARALLARSLANEGIFHE